MQFIGGFIVGAIVTFFATFLFASYQVHKMEASGELEPAFPGEDENGNCAKCHGGEEECAYCKRHAND